MSINIIEDIRSVTELKRNTRAVLDQIHQTKRPIVLTVNGKADAVLIGAETFEKYLQAFNMARLLAQGEKDIAAGATHSARAFFKEFKHAKKISS